MHILFDNLSATVIGGIVLLLLITMQQRLRDLSTEQVMSYAANQHAIEFGTWLQEDMVNVGWNVPTGNGIVSFQPNDTIPALTKLFEFDGYDPSNAAAPTRIQYQLIPAIETGGARVTTDIDGTNVPLWIVQRVVNGFVTGQSAPLISAFSVELLNIGGGDVSGDPTLTEQIRIRFSMAMPFGDDSFLREVHWATSFMITE